ncbi:MAG: hypothetical protein ACPHRO_13085, partial [Nannocystaceae bacterium]
VGLTAFVCGVAGCGLAGCASDGAWEVASRPSCPIPEVRVVCVAASPDLGGTFDVGGAKALPGECVRASTGGGMVAVQVTRDGLGRRRTVRAPKRAVTEVVVVDGRTFRRRYARCPSE